MHNGSASGVASQAQRGKALAPPLLERWLTPPTRHRELRLRRGFTSVLVRWPGEDGV